MAQAIVIHQYGASKVLKSETISLAALKPDEVQVKNTAIGVNFHDVYVRSGLYKTLELPGIPGLEAVGEIIAIGSAVKNFQVGERVYFLNTAYGAYAEVSVVPEKCLYKIPKNISDYSAANLLKLLTVDMLINRITSILPGDTVLVHAAAGNVGQMLCQWLHHLNINVIGTVGSDEKIAIAEQSGCNFVINYNSTDFVTEVNSYTSNRGVKIAFDAVGKTTFYGSLKVLSYLGHLINYGQASGPVAPLEMNQLATKSLSITRPMLFHYLNQPKLAPSMFESVFQAIQQKVIYTEEFITYPIEQSFAAHDLLESRLATKPIVLIPNK